MTVVMRMREEGLLERREENPLGYGFRDIRTREETASRKLNLRAQVSGRGKASAFANLGDRERQICHAKATQTPLCAMP